MRFGKVFVLVISGMFFSVFGSSHAAVEGIIYDLEQLGKVTAGDASAGNRFGRSVGISDNIAIVGAAYNDDSGSAYLYDVTTGYQIAKLTASDAADWDLFGSAVGVSGDTAIVGAWGDDDAGSDSGSAYLFDVATGNQIAKLTASDAAANDYFGRSVAISGNTAIVGAYSDDDAGSAYLFDVTTGTQIAKLTASDAAGNDCFGYSVAIRDNIAIVGAYSKDGAGSDSGAVYLFDVTTGTQITKLTADDATEGDNFGYSVAISGNVAIVGAWCDDDAGSNSGSAYLFNVETGNQIAKLTASDAALDDFFGWSVGIMGEVAIVGACYNDDDGSNSGSAYLFDVLTGIELAKLTASDAAEYDNFGYSVAISENIVFVGSSGDDDYGSNSGSAYFYGVAPEPGTMVLLIIGGGVLTLRRKL